LIMLALATCYYYIRSQNIDGHISIHEDAIKEHRSKHSNIIERVKLKNGFVRYSLYRVPENDSNPLIICLHGISSYSFVWKKMVRALQASGFNVLSLDFYGRGFSDSPNVKYNGDLFCEQIDDLLKALNLQDHKLILFGHSMGGAVATLFASRNLERVSKVVLFAPAGCPVSYTSQLALWFVTIPVISEAAFYFFVEKGMRNYPKRPFHLPHRIPEDIQFAHAMALEQLKHNRGFLRAYLSTLRHFSELTDLTANYAKLEKSSIPTIVFWGTKDRIIPYANTKLLKKLVPSAIFHTLEDTGHQLIFERQEEIEQVLIPFLQSNQ